MRLRSLLTTAIAVGLFASFARADEVLESVEVIDDGPPMRSATAPQTPPKTQAAEDAPPVIVVAPPPPPPKLWEGRIEVGVNGSSGNTENINTRVGINAKRKGPKSTQDYDLLANRSTRDGLETENKAIFKTRIEWPMAATPWSVYLYGTSEYDEFQAWDIRLTGGGGLSYKFIDGEFTKLSGRIGAGASREVGGPDNRMVPEANFGSDFEHKLSARQKLTAAVDIFPEMTDFGEFRAQSKAAWEVLIDPELNLSFKLGVLNRYDTTPQGRKPSDLDYFGLLVWNF